MSPILARLAGLRGTVVVTLFLILVLAIAVQEAFSTRAQIAATFLREESLERAQLALADVRLFQEEEEHAVRAYAITHDPLYARTYADAARRLDQRASDVRQTLIDERMTRAREHLEHYLALQRQWRDDLAEAVVRGRESSRETIDAVTSRVSQLERREIAYLRGRLEVRDRALAVRTQYEIDRTLYIRAFWLLVFGILAIAFNAVRSRLNRELGEERALTEILQRAIRSETVPLPHCEVGAAYSSASGALVVGGDIYDVYRLSEHLALITIADVSGKGVQAAVLTAFIKYTIRAIALRRRDPGAILAEFNTAFAHTVPDPELFVSMFVGILDTQSMVLRYASAGHDAVFVRRSSREVQPLIVTGPVLGVMEEPFGSLVVHLDDGDTIVLATDGLTEARDARGLPLGHEGAVHLIARSTADPQALADQLVAYARARSGSRMRDDVAVLAIRVHPVN